ncbi:exported hypothetical protein [uncultured Stenotrophomonas sp.]|uniref:EF-hand domain-containing protein n=1 Tax=uncultured Stenotrophomonas sp. TaxID=165438 RepID=A0A1Y5Q3V9_9GAMM|nr:exported hypothetical protein [uncultured Stenotrophomonas sp.]
MNAIRPALLLGLAALPWNDCAAQAVSSPLVQAPVAPGLGAARAQLRRHAGRGAVMHRHGVVVQAPVAVREQPLASGAVTHQVQLPAEPGQAAVVVRSIQPDNVAGNYRIDFDALDVDGDGFIGRDEAQANPALADEFDSLDTARRGKLAREQLAGWL